MQQQRNELFSGNTVFLLSDSERVFTVTELSGSIKTTMEKNFSSISVQGEISGVKVHSSGHTYFSLKDDNSVINAICWRGTKIPFPLEEGALIIAKGRVTSYPARSQYQFIIENAVMAGEGALLKLLNERKKKFEGMGYFSKTRPLPKYPQTIGIVTSKTGSVLQDMLHRLRDRYQFCNVVIWPVNVQGNGAAEQIATAVRGFNILPNKKPDIIIVARGGGSIEDLFCFNDEIVVKAVYDSAIPVISAIGHETDTTLIDYAADLRAPTPTAAIEFATPVLSEVIESIGEFSLGLSRSIKRIVNERTNNLSMLVQSLTARKYEIIGKAQKFDDIMERLQKSIWKYFDIEKLKLERQKIANLNNYIQLKIQQFTTYSTIFGKIAENYLSRYEELLESLDNRLEQSSYKKILEKGFCFITNNGGENIKTKSEFLMARKEDLLLNFADGTTGLCQ
jgi:exodeoxyribonuclease VII large subunit